MQAIITLHTEREFDHRTLAMIADEILVSRATRGARFQVAPTTECDPEGSISIANNPVARLIDPGEAAKIIAFVLS